jgi:hypothetical protein
MLKSENSIRTSWGHQLMRIGGLLVLSIALWLYLDNGSRLLLIAGVLGGILALAFGVVIGVVGALKGTHPLLGVKYPLPLWALILCVGLWLYKDGSGLLLLLVVMAGIELIESSIVIAVVHLLKQPTRPYESVLFPKSEGRNADAPLGSG